MCAVNVDLPQGVNATMNDLDFLAQVPLFSRLNTDELAALARHTKHESVLQGNEIIREGDSDRRLFIVMRGTVEVVASYGQRNERRLTTLGSREYFGEMALIDGLARSATVVAREDTELLVLDHVKFKQEIESKPSIALDLLQTLSYRIRALEKLMMQTLGGLLPICLNCKNIRDESGAWVPIEFYISDRSQTEFTHGMCPDCMRKLYPKHFAPK
jgi:CRP/FNR family transcriptional regulator, cyclic AMP receptor protein